MKNQIIYLVFVLFFSSEIYSQNKEADSTKVVGLSEVIVIGKTNLKNTKQVKPLASIDEYLEESSKITMIKRGNYAWEASMNNMLSERLSITIDGMQIFGACTDKMDPITSYVDVSNLSEVRITSGQQGAENGATIGGSIDLRLEKNNFEKEEFNVGIDLGYETNSNARIISSEVNYATKKFFVNVDGIYRKSDNYSSGGDEEVLYSQFEKYNISTVGGVKTGENSAIIGSVIYDKATDVGYPALTMDVSLAEAIIASLSYEIDSISPLIHKWETKVYVNTITHIMDDTKREFVAIHMDMPGWSDTYGFYSKVYAKKSKHNLLFNFNGYYNKSLAEMTMYPNDPNENSMFMLTWPDVRTLYSGIYGEDEITLGHHKALKFSARVGFQHATLVDEFGLNSLQIFYPGLEDTDTRFTFNLSSQYEFDIKKVNLLFNVGYGERAPSVTEAYGFYLYNSFDNYDYIGNPYLNNEKSLEFNTTLNHSTQKLKIGADASFFYISDYIIGKTDLDLTQMTIGADGVRIYTALEYASLFNTSVFATYKLFPEWTLNGSVGYSLGKDNNSNNLPLISPFTYKAAVHFKKNLFDAEVNINGASEQENYSSYFGENKTGAYTLVNLNASYNFYFSSQKLYLKAGVENLFDTSYSTYADWNNIPRMGRNLFINVSYVIR
ncbi:MAG: TonB-dependent receptor [Bacteroidetes bacterium]|nr:TonB-dependent receptor [Bacteroidota bacterium]